MVSNLHPPNWGQVGLWAKLPSCLLYFFIVLGEVTFHSHWQKEDKNQTLDHYFCHTTYLTAAEVAQSVSQALMFQVDKCTVAF